MITFFSNIPTFTDPKNLDIQTFLQLCDMICNFFGLWDTKFSLLRNDVEGNIKKVSRASANLHVNTLYDLLTNDTNRNDDSSGSIGLLWLKRTLQFVNCFLHNLAHSTTNNENELMRDLITQAYDVTLTRYHNKLMRHAFRVLREVEQFTLAIEPHIETLHQMLILFGLEDPTT